MKAASKAVDDKILEANKYADAKRQEFTHVTLLYSNLKQMLIFVSIVFIQNITESLNKVQQGAMGEASNLLGKLNLGGNK